VVSVAAFVARLEQEYGAARAALEAKIPLTAARAETAAA
jgi:hypothetical protein